MPMTDKRPAITPEIKVGVILEHYPELEETLIGMSSTFKKLKNPVLRRTVGKVATLRQVAQVGKISLSELVNTLRSAAGQTLETISESENADALDFPVWFDAAKIVESFDARPIIESGEHPMGEVMGKLQHLKEGDILELVTPFLPAPLIDLAVGKGYKSWSKSVNANLVRTFFTKPVKNAGKFEV